MTLTRREYAVLGYLADGLTAEAIARRMSTRPATVRKHLQNLYAKLGTSDRLGAVIVAATSGCCTRTTFPGNSGGTCGPGFPGRRACGSRASGLGWYDG